MTKQVGLTESLVRKISKEKREPAWMLNIRLKGLKIFQQQQNPTWGVDLSDLDYDKIIYYLTPEERLLILGKRLILK